LPPLVRSGCSGSRARRALASCAACPLGAWQQLFGLLDTRASCPLSRLSLPNRQTQNPFRKFPASSGGLGTSSNISFSVVWPRGQFEDRNKAKIPQRANGTQGGRGKRIKGESGNTFGIAADRLRLPREGIGFTLQTLSH